MIIEWLVIGGIVFFLYKLFASHLAKGTGKAAVKPGASAHSGQKICKACGHVSDGKTATRGSMGIEIALWLCFLIPGLIYSVWRLASRYSACPVCGSAELIPVDSPVGQKLVAEQVAK